MPVAGRVAMASSGSHGPQPAAPCFTERERLYAEADVALASVRVGESTAYCIRPGSTR